MKETEEYTPRNRLYVQRYFTALREKPGKIQDAILKAYSETYPKKYKDKKKLLNSAKKMHYTVMKKPKFAEMLNDAFPNEEHAGLLAEMARNASKPVWYQGEKVGEDPDNSARLTALNQIGNVKGVFQKQRTHEVNILNKQQTLIIEVNRELLNEPDKPVEDIEAQFIEEYEKNMEE